MRQTSLTLSVIGRLGVPHYDGLEAIVAIIIAHSAHLLSVLVLYHLTLAIFAGAAGTALTAAALHIISPAVLFLSAPFAESSCALLTFSGCLLFTKSFGPNSLGRDLLVLASGVATTFRSNKLLSGILLLEEAFRTLYFLRHGFHLRCTCNDHGWPTLDASEGGCI
jgi:phosphatidylinositol glycan class V